LWAVDEGAVKVHVSVDGAEPNPETIAQVLEENGYVRDALFGSKIAWTGQFSGPKAEIIVSSKPGLDIQAVFPGEKLLVAECKGELTPSAVKSGLDRTSFYTAVGQLIISAGGLRQVPDRMVVVLPNTWRLRELANWVAQQSWTKMMGMSFALIDDSGKVREIKTG
jgi:hypothetical protein